MPVLTDRELLKSGISLISHEAAAAKLVREGTLPDHMKVDESWEAKEYRLIYNENFMVNFFANDVELPDLSHRDEHFDQLVDILEVSPRYDPTRVDRIETELTFFDRTFNIKFLLRLHRMVEDFKRDGVVWGVGRGSAVASYVLYLLEIHDINPCEYGIPFHELSKESD